MSNLLIDAIKSRLEKEICPNLLIQGPSEDERDTDVKLYVPTIFKGFLPPKSAPDPNKPPEFPHIIIRPTEGGMQPDMDTVRVKFLLGGFCEDPTGYEWLMIVLGRMAKDFQEKPVLDMQYEFQNDIHWKLFDDQPYPFWVMEAIGSWSVIKPQYTQFQDDL
ncbi:hypothetical protein M3T68_001702 [Salmonella enterica]|nr:hypothetical protein [Salmonella enterica]EJE4377749.1 hypothetical protein [Salmonella enterica]